MPKPVILTAAMLRKLGTCRGQLKIFQREWPDGAAINLKNARRALMRLPFPSAQGGLRSARPMMLRRCVGRVNILGRACTKAGDAVSKTACGGFDSYPVRQINYEILL